MTQNDTPVHIFNGFTTVQSTVFDFPATAQPHTPTHTHRAGKHLFHRTEDTSLQAYKNLRRGQQEVAVLEAFRVHGRSTANELSEASGIRIRGCAARISELYVKGMLEIYDVVTDKYSMQSAFLYGLMPEEPVPSGWFCISDLLHRGWKKSEINQFRHFAESEQNPHAAFGSPMLLFPRHIIESIEANPDFKKKSKTSEFVTRLGNKSITKSDNKYTSKLGNRLDNKRNQRETTSKAERFI